MVVSGVRRLCSDHGPSRSAITPRQAAATCGRGTIRALERGKRPPVHRHVRFGVSPMATTDAHAKPGNGSARSGASGSAFALEEGTRNRPLLVVEDDDATREMLRYLVQSVGCPVVTAANGLEALEHLRNGLTPCLILLDLMMPVMDGC